ncbi:MAG TPA: hypothetical protein VFX16_12810 [Pseudonocardiaceae bacterium]|nr:hypothetical protein [Pseudonocardiaceae bacterium]
MDVEKVSLGVIQSRGANVIDPGLVKFGTDEADFLARHVRKARSLNDASPRSLFEASSNVPTFLDRLRTAPDDEFESIAKTLQDALVAMMQASTNASDCVFATVVTQDPGQQKNVTLLKLDAVVEAARLDFLSSGRVTLQVLRELLPEPGRLQKALSWPDPRPESDAISIDTNVRAAKYFENAFDLHVSVKSSEAEADLSRIIVEYIPPARLPDAFSAASSLRGPLDEVLSELSQHGYPELDEPANSAALNARPAGVIRMNKVAARTVVWRADGIEIKVPPHMVGRLTIEPDVEDDGWRIVIKTRTRPMPGT